MEWIEEKAETGKIKPVKEREPEREEASNVIDLTDLLRKSMGDSKPTKKKAKAKGA
jgi:non-homologous end joining protein Ku